MSTQSANLPVRAEPLPVGPRDPKALPAWYPNWARTLADNYLAGATSVFVLHGNVYDLQGYADGQRQAYANLSEFLATQVFGSWDIVLHYDVGRGLRPLAGPNSERLRQMMEYLTPRLGEPAAWPRDPENVLAVLDRLIERSLLEEQPSRRKNISIIFDHAQYLVPAGDLTTIAQSAASRLVRILGWAQNPYLKRINVACCLIADKLSEVNDRLVQSAHVATLEVPIPDLEARRGFVQFAAAEGSAPSGLSVDEAAELSNGLALASLNVLLAQAQQAGGALSSEIFRGLKKSMIERQCQGLVEFVEPKHTLDLVVGQEAAKRRLAEDAACLSRGQLDAAPMGYLISGPVGTGKTFLAECYAGSIGIPCVKLRNFRSKYVGETEGNLELLLRVLRSLGPVVVIIDEADAALGSRRADGDSGTSARVFSMIASQMGDTQYRGRILWMLLTSRPDLLPIDLKRQGRAEVHIPLFYPQDAAEMGEMLRVMARKNRIQLPSGLSPELTSANRLSGADIESVLLAAKRRYLAAGRDAMLAEDMDEALRNFIPSVQGLEKELQELAAVLECTEVDFLPPGWREKIAGPDARSRLQERLVAIRQIIES